MKKSPGDIAVSVEFDRHSMAAPRVSSVAERLRVKEVLAIARRYGIPLEENPELASELFELGENSEIPQELYDKLAAVLIRLE